MPIYEYQCDACGHELEVIQSISDPLLSDCPDCGEAQLRKLISASAFRLKGGGWYETDFKSKNKRNLADGGGSSSSSDGGTDSGGSSGKSDKKSDSSSKTAASADS
jgi:putative FmdB family regulatory protein